MRGFNLSRWAIEHRNLTRFTLILLVLVGGFAFFQLGQKEDPEFTFRAMVIRAVWPGATVSEMEDQVTARLERKLQETPWVEFSRSYAKAGETLIFVNLRQDTPPREVPNVWYQVRKKLGDVRQTLPSGVLGPFFNDEFGETYSAIYGISGEGFSYAELKGYADRVRDALLQTPKVNKVELIGEQEQRIWVTIPQRRLDQLGIGIDAITRSLAGQNEVDPSGIMVTPTRDVRLRVDGHFPGVEAISDLRLAASGGSFRLGDVADVARGYVDPPVYGMRVAGRPSIGLGVVMASDGNVVQLGPKLKATVERLQASFPIGIEIRQVTNEPKVVATYIGEFLISLGEAVVIVLAVSFVSLGFRMGVVVALTIPLVLAITFAVMAYFGIALQKISLGALIIALGLLVDDAMIAVEMMARKLEEGMDRLSAASFAFTSTAFPMLTGTLITIAGFLPIGLAKSTAGEYTFSIFAVVGIALIVSWFAAVFFTPYLGWALLKAKPNRAGHDVFDGRVYRMVRRVVEFCIRRRWWTIAATIALFCVGIFGFTLVPQSFFPASNRSEVMVDLTLAEGSGYQETEASVLLLERWLAKDPDVIQVTAYVGGGSPRFYLPLDQQLQSANFAQLMLETGGLEARERVIGRLRGHLSTNLPGIRARVDRLNSGPPVGWPVQFRVRGEDPALLAKIAASVASAVRDHPLAFDVHDDWHEAVPMVRLEIDQDRARALGVSSRLIRQTLAGVTSGVQIGALRDGDELVPIVVRGQLTERSDLSEIMQTSVRTESGATAPLSQFATLRPGTEPGVHWRRNRLPTITVQANIPDEAQPPDVSKAIDRALDPIRATLPAGYSIEAGGAVEESAKSQASIFVNMPVMAVVILVLLMIQLQHFGRTMIVFLTAPLGVIGAVAALLAFGAPFGFTAILGVIALSGMIMRNSVILVDQIEQEIASGHAIAEAIVNASVARFRPIMLTAAAAVLALAPLTRNVFWGPMSIAMMGGLIVATILTLTFLPALYAAWFRAPANSLVTPEVERLGGFAVADQRIA